MQEMRIHIISNKEDEFPYLFEELPQPLTKFAVAGNIKLLKHQPKVAIIGSRKHSIYGKEVAQGLSTAAASAGAVVVSGLALGIDGVAHKSALESGGYTIAVLPSSIDNIYPASHVSLARRIYESEGLLISEFFKDSSPMKHHFIQRNRLIAALADVVLVVEASEKSGSLHTVNFALENGKTIAAVPGPINKPGSAGTNQLIKDGAIPITSSQDLLDLLGLSNVNNHANFVGHNSAENMLLSVLGINSYGTEELAKSVNMKLADIYFHLSMLEMRGVIMLETNKKWRIVKI